MENKRKLMDDVVDGSKKQRIDITDKADQILSYGLLTGMTLKRISLNRVAMKLWNRQDIYKSIKDDFESVHTYEPRRNPNFFEDLAKADRDDPYTDRSKFDSECVPISFLPFEKFSGGWERSHEDILKSVSKLISWGLPSSLEDDLKDSIKSVGIEIYHMVYQYFNVLRVPTKHIIHFLNNIQWTPRGRVDFIKTSRVLLNSDKLEESKLCELSDSKICEINDISKYAIACTYFLNEHVSYLLPKLIKRDASLDKWCDNFDGHSLPMVLYLTFVYMPEKVGKLLLANSFRNPYTSELVKLSENVFYNMISKIESPFNINSDTPSVCGKGFIKKEENTNYNINYEVAIKSVWSKLEAEERSRVISVAPIFKVLNADTQCFLLSHMTEEEQMQVFQNDKTCELVLETLLEDNFWKENFIHTFNHIKSIIPTTTFCEIIKRITSSPYIKNHDVVLRNLWACCPDSLKIKVYCDMNVVSILVTYLLKLQDTKMLKSLFSLGNVEQKLEILTSIEVAKTCICFMLENKWEFFDDFICCALASDKEAVTKYKKLFVGKEAIFLCSNFIDSDDALSNWDSVQCFTDRFFETSEELVKFKYLFRENAAVVICDRFLLYSKWEEITSLLNWCCPLKEDILSIKKLYVSEKGAQLSISFLRKHNWAWIKHFLEWCCQSEDEVKNFKKSFTSDGGRVWGLLKCYWEYEHANRFLRWSFDAEDEVRYYRKKYMDLHGFKNCNRLLQCDDYSKKLQSFLNWGCDSEDDIIHFKKEFMESSVARDLCDQLISVEIYDDDDDNDGYLIMNKMMNWGCGSDEKIKLFKEKYISIQLEEKCIQFISASEYKRLNTFLNWCFDDDDQRLQDFMKTFRDNRGRKMYRRFARSCCYSSEAKALLSWCCKTKEEEETFLGNLGNSDSDSSDCNSPNNSFYYDSD